MDAGMNSNAMKSIERQRTDRDYFVKMNPAAFSAHPKLLRVVIFLLLFSPVLLSPNLEVLGLN
jgi:hypothetical protein